jgi:hypothetical protein
MPPALVRLLPFAVPAAVAVVLLGGLVSVLSRSEPRLAGTNNVPLKASVLTLAPGERGCQAGQIVPEGAGQLRLFGDWGTHGVNAVATIADANGKPIAAGPLRADGRTVLNLAMDSPRTVLGATICVTNHADQPLHLSGIQTALGSLTVGAKKEPAAITALYYRRNHESWAALLPDMLARAGYAKLAGPWLGWLGLVVALAAFAVAGLTVALATRREV